MPVEADNIYTAMLAVYKAVDYVQKQRSDKLPYSFAGEAALIEALRPAMVEQGIIMHVLEVGDIFRETYITHSGTPMNRTCARLAVRFIHAPSGTFIDAAAVGEGADAGDKSTPKAMTGAFKYALRETFCIETGDDPDEENSDTQVRESPFTTARARLDEPALPDALLCRHGKRVYRKGMKDGKPWAAWFCQQPKGQPQCDVIWTTNKAMMSEGNDDIPFE